MAEVLGYSFNGAHVLEIKIPNAERVTAEVKEGSVVVRWQESQSQKS